MNPYRVPELTITPFNDGSGRFRFRGKLSSIQINDRNYTAFKNEQHFEGGGIEESKESEDSIITRILTYNPGATKESITAHLEDKMQKEIVQAAAMATKGRKTRKQSRQY
jgi:D-alanine-D-alanine ligase-like ATP-grasp enzyme